MKKNIKILCTLGPSSLNKEFLNFSRGKVSLLRLNMSHLQIKDLAKTIKFVKKYTDTPICIDTEGAQIRTKVIKKIFIKKNKRLIFGKNKSNLQLYPHNVFDQLKRNDILDVGFEGLLLKIIKKNNKNFITKAINAGWLQTNKGVHLVNRSIKLNFVTKKDLEAIKIAKYFKIKNFALSFTNNVEDINKFEKLLKNKNNIYKLETKKAVKNLDKILLSGKNFLIDRGDLSKEITLEKLPIIQRKILKKNNNKRNIYVATNFLESMLENSYPTRAEVNDIFNTLELGSSGLVLAAETAIGRYPKECVLFLKKMILTYKKFYKK